MKYKAVLFDFDDTLVESRRMKWDHHKFAAKYFYNLDLTDDDIKEHWGKPMAELLRLLSFGQGDSGWHCFCDV
jgi:beta-phosphoglucomutase-like phosphatase (HAD superfamily)